MPGPAPDRLTSVAHRAGLFGPDSASWRIDREVMVLAGGTCALLMQLAHPAVAAGVAEHSNFRDDPFARLRRTLSASFDVVFGSAPRAERALAGINAVHRSISGVIPETGATYNARDPTLLLWVHATLVDTAIRVYHRYVAPLSPGERQRYHDESRLVARSLGVPAELIPRTLDELRSWMADRIQCGDVWVTPTARSLATSVLYPARLPPRFVWDVAHLVSLSVMPPAIRSDFGLPWNARRAAGAERLAGATRAVLPLLPAPLRFVPQYRTAVRRAGGRLR
ncbi:MAG: DUF2236 domain-containing protein [Chloroflexi bacterium]|nr:MAG: DUF2236 domain-containing protein [Chloroflexota bacterium]